MGKLISFVRSHGCLKWSFYKRRLWTNWFFLLMYFFFQVMEFFTSQKRILLIDMQYWMRYSFVFVDCSCCEINGAVYIKISVAAVFVSKSWIAKFLWLSCTFSLLFLVSAAEYHRALQNFEAGEAKNKRTTAKGASLSCSLSPSNHRHKDFRYWRHLVS